MAAVLGQLLGAGPVAAATDGLGAIAKFVGQFFHDKPAEDQAAATLALQELVGSQANALAQVQVDANEASSPDRLNHWRGFLGWGCAVSICWHFIGLPVFQYGFAVAIALGAKIVLPAPPDFSSAELDTILYAMLGIVGTHGAPAIVKAFTRNGS